MLLNPFQRTTCACTDCTACCKRQPGFLIPGDLERIASYLGETVEKVKAYFWSSEGALVQDSNGRQYRIRTITPRYDKRKKRCVFLTDDDKCSIHEVAPFGCSFVDTHMSFNAGNQRSAWAMTQVMDSEAYVEQRKSLPFCDHYKPTNYGGGKTKR